MNIILITLFSLFFIILFLISPAVPRREAMALRNIMFAHRGLHSDTAPENSLAAFKAAKEAGYGVELDVQLSSDGEVMVFHDESLQRMCSRGQQVNELTKEQLASTRLADSEECIPTLQDVLTCLCDTPLICEIKAPPGESVQELCEKTEALLRTYSGPYGVESFSPFAVRWFYKHAPDVLRGQLAEPAQDRRLHRILAANLCFNFISRPDFVAYNSKNTRSPGFQAMRLFGIPLIAWTLRSEKELQEAEKVFHSFIFE